MSDDSPKPPVFPLPETADPAAQNRPRGKSMVVPWAFLVVAAGCAIGEYSVINTWKNGSCNINLTVLFWLGLLFFAVMSPVATFIQQMRSPSGYRRAGMAIPLYILGGLIILVALFSVVPIIFADMC